MSFRVLNSFPDFFAVPSTTTKALFYFFIFFFSTKSTINISIRRILKCINKREVKLRLRIIVTSLRNFCSAWFHRYVLWNLLGKIRMEAKKIDFFFFSSSGDQRPFEAQWEVLSFQLRVNKSNNQTRNYFATNFKIQTYSAKPSTLA